MTVKELIKLLQKVPNQDAIIYSEGCDCTGFAHGLNILADDEVEISRGCGDKGYNESDVKE